MEPFHVSATGYSINYLPQYIAERHGFFREQGLDVTCSVPQPWEGVLDELSNGTADIALGGIWVPLMYQNRVKNYTLFAQLSNHAPLALLKRGPCEDFKLADIVGGTVLINSGGGASYGVLFKMLLCEKGIDPRSVDFVHDLNGPMLGELFRGGMVDFFITDMLSAQVIAEQNSNISVAMETITEGNIPWSVYYRETTGITPEALDKQRRFHVALAKGVDWVLEHDAESLQDELAELFPSAPVHVSIGVVNSFRHNGMWNSLVISREGYERWQAGLVSARLVNGVLPYETLIDNTSIEAAFD